MNKLYLLLPVAKKEPDEHLKLLLNETQFKNGREAFDYFKNIYRVIDSMGYEDYDGVYDRRQLGHLFEVIEGDKQLSKESPSPDMMKAVLNSWMDYHDDYYQKVTHKAVGTEEDYLKGYKDIEVEELDFDGNLPFILFGTTEVKDTIFNAYFQNKDADSVTFINQDASRYSDKDLDQQVSGDVIPIKMLPVEFKAIYEWFVKHRNPQRDFDEYYNKHGERSKFGRKGMISPLTYKSKNEIKDFLVKAVGAKDGGARQLFFYDKAKDKYLYFWNENTPDLLYHAYEVSPDNMKEIDKILSKGGRVLKDVIDDLGND